MGIDMWLEWDGMVVDGGRRERLKFSIAQGKSGYLRASIWMARESAVLYKIFADAFVGDRFSFDENAEVARDTLAAYVGNEDVDSVEAEMYEEEALEQAERLQSVLKSLGLSGAELKRPDEFSEEDRVVWLKSVEDFYALGLALERAGKNPIIIIEK